MLSTERFRLLQLLKEVLLDAPESSTEALLSETRDIDRLEEIRFNTKAC
ncbi:hypothetical protein HAT2_00672 [Candidatus Similichlamydia laticola]|uniref:Uncharacterized protein n=1 Tax=Candidatus Similichlamydia laticola TaxID=2170265 RepID=A0A369KC66_9BACT|nr:hypothetical protein HAT2_00672 [Candidatus Similichlamydia laticola]